MLAASMMFLPTVPAACAQQEPAGTLHVTTRLVLLDVTVTDAQGKPITDLTRDDFTVLEDGVAQRIRSFEPPSAHALPATSMTEAEEKAEVFDPATPANFSHAPVTVLVLDQLNTHFADSAFAKRELEKYLATQPPVLHQPTTLVTIYQGHVRELAPFTLDRDKLATALKAAPVKYSWDYEKSASAGPSPVDRLDTSLRALEEMSESYARIPGRKTILWVGGGFPSIDPQSLADKDYAEVQSDLKHVNQVLLESRVTLFAVDPSSTAAGMSEITNFQQMAAAQLGGADGINLSTVDEGADFDSMSRMTGGRVVRSMNNVAAQIGTALAYSEEFYTLGYSPQSAPDTLQLRRIQVLCRRPGAIVLTRTGYYAGHPGAAEDDSRAAYDLSTAAESSVPLNALHITAEANPSVDAEGDAWSVRVSAPGLTWAPSEDGSAKATVEIMAVSLAKDGHMLGHTLHAGTAVARAGVNLADMSKMAVFPFVAKPSPKAATMRFVVRDRATGRMGTFDLSLRPGRAVHPTS